MKIQYKLRISDEVAFFIKGLHPDLKKKIKAGLKQLITNPETGKPLKSELTGLNSFRIGRFRIIYRIGSGTVIGIVAVGPRKKIYEATYRLIRKGHEPASDS
ncbi:MAG: type II toxin-antitoxin system RelE/ParE family toxin [Desulfobacterales bacterium]|nr:type II toxin-antitoxin system RelE/ParE family toxin [Desulfobacterales bacterium]